MARRRPQPLTDQLREAIDKSGQSRYRIAKETAIDESTLAKFYNHKGGLSMEALDRLGEYLELKITVGQKPVKRKGR